MSRAHVTAALSAVILVAFALPASAQYDSARSTTVKSSKSNTSDRTTTVKSSKSNTSDRKAGGGAKGGPAGLAVSDEGAQGSKPVKGGKK